MRRFFLGAILVIAFLLRTVSLSSYPVGFTPDEASFGYDAYSLLATGKDQWGESWPPTFRSFGDFKLPVYTYLTMPSVAVFGLNEFAVRLPNALIGTFAVLATYLMVLQLFSKKGNLALFSALLLAISPWHLSLSRGAFEANLTTFFVPLGVWSFYRGLNSPRRMTVSALILGINMFTYHSARLFTPLLVIGLLWMHRNEFLPVAESAKKYRWAAVVGLVFAAVAGYTMFSGAGARGADVAIFNPTDRWAAVSDRRYEAVLQGIPDDVARAFSNKATYVWDQLVGGYFSYLSPQFLFTQGAGEWTYGMIPGRGVLYLIEVAFLLAALWVFVKRRGVTGLNLVILWILLAPIPAALAKGPGFAANRAAVMMPALQIFSAYGAVVLWERWKRFSIFHFPFSIFKIGLFAYLFIGLLSLIFFLEDYRYHAPIHGASSMLYGRQEVVEYTKSVEGNYEEIVFSRSLSEPHIYVAFYGKWDPADYQKQSQDWLRYEKEGRSFVDQLGEYQLGKYTFRNIDKIKDFELRGALLVGKPNEFPVDVVPLKTINYPNREPAILIVDPAQKAYATKTN